MKSLKTVLPAVMVASVLSLGMGSAMASCDQAAAIAPHVLVLTVSQEVGHAMDPKTPADARGWGAYTYNPVSHQINFEIHFEDLSGNPSMAHFHFGHAGSNGPILQTICGHPDPTLLGQCPASKSGVVKGSWIVPSADIAKVVSGDVFVNFHTALNPAGEIRAQLSGI